MTSGRVSFDLIARPYKTLEYLTFGNMLEKTRLHYLPNLARCRNALVLGDGDGRFLSRLLAANQKIRATAVDNSGAMLRLLRQRCEANVTDCKQRLRIIQSDVRTFVPTETYDLIVTHFFLDCFSQEDLGLLVRRLVPSLAPEASWLISEFRIPKGALALPAGLLVRSLYLAFRILTGLRATHLPDYGIDFRRSDLSRIAFHHHYGGILTSELWQKESVQLTEAELPASH